MSERVPPAGIPTSGYYPDLKGKVAVVTGGSRGIGLSTARALAANGVAVAVAGRNPEALDMAVRDVATGGGRVVGVPADCTVEGDLRRLSQVVSEKLGPVDILAAFAGGDHTPVRTLDETPSHWREVLEHNLTATFLTVSAFLEGMVRRRSGAIITMSSAAARLPAHSFAAYAAAKAGVVAFTRHVASEHAGDGIRVNCIAPSRIENENLREAMTEDERRALAADFPLKRLGQCDDVAAAALYLASSASSWITGVTLDVAGGKVML